MNLYAYCLCHEIDGAGLEKVIGMTGARPFGRSSDGLTAVVSESDGGPISVTRENVLAHERVVSQVFAQMMRLPSRFGALLKPAELDRYLAANRLSLLALLARVRGMAEMSVKIISHPGSAAVPQPAQAAEGPGRGTMFIAAKQRELAETKMSDEQA